MACPPAPRRCNAPRRYSEAELPDRRSQAELGNEGFNRAPPPQKGSGSFFAKHPSGRFRKRLPDPFLGGG